MLTAQRGMTLIELVTVVCMLAVLAAIALPSYVDSVRAGRRSDGIGALAAMQAAEEHYRGTHTRYGASADIGAVAASPAGYYSLDVVAHGASGYVAVAAASGAQAADRTCRWLQLASSGDEVSFASGPDRSVGNDAGTNRRCWHS